MSVKYVAGEDFEKEVVKLILSAKEEIVIVSDDLSEFLDVSVVGRSNEHLFESAISIGESGDYRLAFELFDRARMRVESLKSEFEKESLDSALMVPFLGVVYNNLGYCSIKLEDYQKALGYLKRGAELNPRQQFVNNNLATVYERLGNFEKAREHYKKELEINPKHPTARQSLEKLK